MTAEECIERFTAKPSTKYPNRYDVDGSVHLTSENLTEILIPFGVVNGFFTCAHNQLATLYNSPIEVHGNFWCHNNKLTTLEHLPKYIVGDLYCQKNPFQNLNVLKDVTIKGTIWFHHKTEIELDYLIKALYNTDLDALEYHYDNHKYKFLSSNLENYVMNELEEIIKLKRLKRDLNL